MIPSKYISLSSICQVQVLKDSRHFANEINIFYFGVFLNIIYSCPSFILSNTLRIYAPYIQLIGIFVLLFRSCVLHSIWKLLLKNVARHISDGWRKKENSHAKVRDEGSQWIFNKQAIKIEFLKNYFNHSDITLKYVISFGDMIFFFKDHGQVWVYYVPEIILDLFFLSLFHVLFMLLRFCGLGWYVDVFNVDILKFHLFWHYKLFDGMFVWAVFVVLNVFHHRIWFWWMIDCWCSVCFFWCARWSVSGNFAFLSMVYVLSLYFCYNFIISFVIFFFFDVW